MNSFARSSVTQAVLLTFVTLAIPLGFAGPSAAAEQAPLKSKAYPDWKHSGSIWLLTTPDGADLPDAASVEGFPLLVRLHPDFFDFRQAQAHGEDVRFSSLDGERLAYQIEEWDAEQKVASLWVRVPKITGNSRQEIRLHWGNASAASESDGKAVFNESNGYVSVWHMNDPVRDEVGTLPSTDTGTTAVTGRIGPARRFPGGKGIFCGEKIPNYPSGASSHSTEAWFRIERPNTTIIGWGNEGGGRGSKVRMMFRSPPHIRIDSDFSDVMSASRLPLGEWIHVAHTYHREDGRIYINGKLDGAAKPLLDIKSPARLWLGGWYHNYDFVGDLDEVRISRVTRSADWIKLQYENQKPQQTLVGPVVRPGNEFSVSQSRLEVAEGRSATVTAQTAGAQKIFWIVKQAEIETIAATDRLSYTFEAPRVTGDNKEFTLQFRAIYPDEVKTRDIPILIQEAVPEPEFTLSAPATWDGRQPLEIVPRISNLQELETQRAKKLNLVWTVDHIAVIKHVSPGKLILLRAQGSGEMRVSVAIDNGGGISTSSVSIQVTEPADDPWAARPAGSDEQPEDGQFIARDGQDTGTLVYAGTLTDAVDSVFVRVYADDKLFATETGMLKADKTYFLPVKLKAGLVKYRTEFGTKTAARETVRHTASNIVCGDAYLITGQSNAVATDFGKDSPLESSDWVRTFGATDGGPQGSRLKLWANAEARSPGGKSEIGYWGLDLGCRLVESEKIPICIINGAVGGSRIDQHQRNDSDPTDAGTIYGRMLWRVQQAKLTHGIRAVLWHQGENDQGADGPTGGYGYETYRQYFIDLAAAWKTDYPNIQRYYAFQIWPKACAMGHRGSDNRLREVQRTLPLYFSNLSVLSTLGIKPPGGCHFPREGYAEFARLIAPMIEHQLYGRPFNAPVSPPNLRRAFFADDARETLVLDFDVEMDWSDVLTSQFYLDGEANRVASGSASGRRIELKLLAPSKAGQVTYLDSDSWNPDRLLYGKNGISALTFCEVPIIEKPTAP